MRAYTLNLYGLLKCDGPLECEWSSSNVGFLENTFSWGQLEVDIPNRKKPPLTFAAYRLLSYQIYMHVMSADCCMVTRLCQSTCTSNSQSRPIKLGQSPAMIKRGRLLVCSPYVTWTLADTRTYSISPVYVSSFVVPLTIDAEVPVSTSMLNVCVFN